MPVSHFPTDPDENAASIVNLGELLFSCLEAIDAGKVVEVGAFHGKSTRDLLTWAGDRDARIVAVDPAPEVELRELASEHPELELLERSSIEALEGLDADAVILDGDHNYFTLTEELRLIEAGHPGAALPLVIAHDIGWPLARRDAYYAPERVPPEHRQPLARNVFLAPGEAQPVAGGMPFACVAEREGGPANGILTAVEDFISDRPELRLAVVPAFFGLGFIWHRDAPWAEPVAELLAPWDGNPMVARMEENRIRQMTERYRITKLLDDLEARAERQRDLLAALRDSRALGLAERLSGLVRRGRPAFSREEVREVLDESEA